MMLVTICASVVVACGNSDKKSASELMQEYMYGSGGGAQPDYAESNPNSSQMEMCPMCNGAGTIQEVPGSPVSSNITCSACGGRGACDATTAQQVREAKAQVERMFGKGSSSGENYGSNSRQDGEKECWNCNGRGTCSSCAGRGEYYAQGMYGQPGRYLDCPICKGTGRCTVCNGRGRR